MINQYIFTLSHISSDESISTDKLINAYELMTQFDERLRKELELEFRNVDLIDECKELIRNEGVSWIMSLKRLQAALLTKSVDIQEKDILVEMLRDMLMKLSPSKNLIIVDNYFFPSKTDKNEYLQMFKDIFLPSIGKVASFNFITKPNFDQNLFQDCKRLLLTLNPNLNVDCKTTDDFHDRFWIVDQTKGLFVGTSLNGVGKRYALVDFIRDEDTKEIVNTLEQLKLV
jgi:hypothetical protein